MNKMKILICTICVFVCALPTVAQIAEGNQYLREK